MDRSRARTTVPTEVGTAVGPTADARVRSALDVMLDAVAIGRAIRDDQGRIEDFVIVYANQRSADGAGRGPEEMVGARVNDLYPNWRRSGMMDLFVRVVETGEPYVVERQAYEDVTADGVPISGYWSLQVTKLDDGYLAASRDATEIVRADELVRENERLARAERDAVQLLQAAALPRFLPPVPHLEVAALYEPASDQAIGGDWYDAFPTGDGRLALVIADVAGHGRTAAAYMVKVRNLLRAATFEAPDPSAALALVNRMMLAFGPDRREFVTCCLALVDPDQGELMWSRAGHPDPLLRQGDRWRYPEEPGGPPLGAYRDASFPVAHTTIAPGDAALFFTDGLVERRDEILDIGIARLADALAADDADSPIEAVRALVGSFGARQDDIAALAVERTAP